MTSTVDIFVVYNPIKIMSNFSGSQFDERFAVDRSMIVIKNHDNISHLVKQVVLDLLLDGSS